MSNVYGRTAERTAETSDSTADAPQRIQRLRTLGTLLDNSIPIPGTGYRIGLDPIVGLLPVLGDLPTSAMSAYIVVEAAALGVPKPTLARMLANLLVDATLGSIPVVGDAFDAVWKANLKNIELLESRAIDPDGASSDTRVLVGGTALLFTLLFGLGVATAAATVWVLSQLGLSI